MGAPELDLLITFAVVLIAAELGSLLFQALRLPRIIGMIVAGILIGPNVNAYSDVIGLQPASISDLAFLGGIFLMFSIGLTFNVREFQRVGGGALLVATAAGLFSFAGGFVVALAVGQDVNTALFVGLILTPTSSVIGLRLAQEQNLLATRGIDTTIAGIVLDDVVSLFLATIVLAFVGLEGREGLSGVLAGLLLLLVLGLIIVLVGVRTFPWTLHWFERFGGTSPVLPALSLAFLTAFVFTLIGLPPIFGAFWAGSILASSRFGDRIQEFVRPVTEIFSAIFFTSVGMLLNPGLVGGLGTLVIATILVAVGAKFAGGFLALRSTRTPTLPALACATLLIPRGEVSLVIAQYAGSGPMVATLQWVATVVVIATTLLAPFILHGVRGYARRRSRAAPTPAA